MHFLDKRVNVICEELKKLKVKQKFTIDNWKYKEGNFIRPEEAEADNAAWEDFDCQNMHWYGKDRQYGYRRATAPFLRELSPPKAPWSRPKAPARPKLRLP